MNYKHIVNTIFNILNMIILSDKLKDNKQTILKQKEAEQKALEGRKTIIQLCKNAVMMEHYIKHIGKWSEFSKEAQKIENMVMQEIKK